MLASSVSEKFADFAWKEFERVDAILNYAGIILPFSSEIDTQEEEVRRIFDVNFFGVRSLCAVFGKRLIEQDTPAAIYNVGSENSLSSGRSSIDEVAEKLLVSKRTLQRRLKEEETSLQTILNRVREKLARHYQTNSSFSAKKISFLLGYDDPNFFSVPSMHGPAPLRRLSGQLQFISM